LELEATSCKVEDVERERAVLVGRSGAIDRAFKTSVIARPGTGTPAVVTCPRRSRRCAWTPADSHTPAMSSPHVCRFHLES
jgi:hypothetical protein